MNKHLYYITLELFAKVGIGGNRFFGVYKKIKKTKKCNFIMGSDENRGLPIPTSEPVV